MFGFVWLNILANYIVRSILAYVVQVLPELVEPCKVDVSVFCSEEYRYRLCGQAFWQIIMV